MATENKIEKIKTLIENATVQNGGQGNVACTDDAHHGCWATRPHGWDAPAVQIEGNILSTGRLCWDFDEYIEENGEVEDAGSYPWDDEAVFVTDEKFDLTDEDDCDYIINNVF